jgi:type IV secretory pathway VirB3-like protein
MVCVVLWLVLYLIVQQDRNKIIAAISIKIKYISFNHQIVHRLINKYSP